MELTRVEQRAYIKITVLRERNATECHSELVEALGKNALPYRTVRGGLEGFNKDACQPLMSSIQDDQPVCGPTWHLPSSSSSLITLRVMDCIKGL
ncbi:HTH_48 domain-containing protein [Trichonephila clavipes]|nr:HTH_48 domain-containing protein [Trichonephila clavipes]